MYPKFPVILHICGTTIVKVPSPFKLKRNTLFASFINIAISPFLSQMLTGLAVSPNTVTLRNRAQAFTEFSDLVIFRFYDPVSLPFPLKTIFSIVIFHCNKVLCV